MLRSGRGLVALSDDDDRAVKDRAECADRCRAGRCSDRRRTRVVIMNVLWGVRLSWTPGIALPVAGGFGVGRKVDLALLREHLVLRFIEHVLRNLEHQIFGAVWRGHLAKLTPDPDPDPARPNALSIKI